MRFLAISTRNITCLEIFNQVHAFFDSTIIASSRNINDNSSGNHSHPKTMPPLRLLALGATALLGAPAAAQMMQQDQMPDQATCRYVFEKVQEKIKVCVAKHP